MSPNESVAMARKTIQGSICLAQKIRQKRNELELTIKEAASRAGVGTKTWCRYEAGESIRSDKLKGVCKALNWLCLNPGKPSRDLLQHVSRPDAPTMAREQ